MAIVYTYPVTTQPSVNDLLLMSKKNQQNNTMNTRVTDIINLVPSVLDLDDFPLYGEPFGDLGATPQPGDTISYDGTNWVPGPPGTAKTQIVNVTAITVASDYVATVPGITALDQEVVYKTTFDATNTVSPVTLNINGYGAKNIVRALSTGLEDIPVDLIVSGVEYFLTYNSSEFQIHTSNPSSGASSEYINPDPVTETIGGIKVGTTFPVKADGVSGYTMQEMWDKLLYPYQFPTLSGLSISGISTSVDVGYDIIAGPYTFNWSNGPQSSIGNIVTNSGVISDVTNGTVLANNVSVGTAGSSAIVSILSDITKTTGGATHKFSITGTDTQGGAISPSVLTITWLWRRFIGTSGNDVLLNTEIPLLTVNTALATNVNGTYNFPGGGFKFLCIPVTFPEPTKITLGGIDVSMADGSTASSAAYNQTGSGPFKFMIVNNVQNSEGESIDYRVYRTLSELNNPVTFIVS